MQQAEVKPRGKKKAPAVGLCVACGDGKVEKGAGMIDWAPGGAEMLGKSLLW